MNIMMSPLLTMILLLLLAALLPESSCAFSSVRVVPGRSLFFDDIHATTKAGRWRQTATIITARPASSTSSLAATVVDETTSTATSSSSVAPVKRVAIIGAGISGLSLAHALRSTHLIDSIDGKKYVESFNNGDNDKNNDVNNDYSNDNTPIQIDIFDARPSLDEKSGSGVQLTGGMAALRNISPDLQKEVSEAALPFERVVSVCRPWFGDDDGKGWKILELDIQEEIRKKFAKGDNNGGQEKNGLVSGDSLQEALQLLLQTRLMRKGLRRIRRYWIWTVGGNYDSRQDGSLVTEDGEVLAYTLLRGKLQSILEERLKKEQGIKVQFDRRLCGLSYSKGEEEDGITCQFTDGSQTGPYDLVIGCDGIQSAVREYVNTGKILPPPSDDEAKKGSRKKSAIYSGLRITFAIKEGSEEEENIDGCQFTQFFGNGAYAVTSSFGAGKGKPPARGVFFVYPDQNYIGPFPRSKSDDDDECEVGTDTIVAASTSEECTTEPVKLDENPDWTQDKRTSREKITECLEIVKSTSIPGNDVASIIEKSDRFFDLGVYLHNPFSLQGWVREVPTDGSSSRRSSGSGKYVVTAGDASHAMPPFLGQGANQALQDSCSLAAKIHEYNTKVQQPLYMMNDPPFKPDLKVSLKEYEHRRWLPTTSITAKAAFLGYLEVGPSVFSNFRDAFFFVMGKIGVAKKVFLDAATPKM